MPEFVKKTTSCIYDAEIQNIAFHYFLDKLRNRAYKNEGSRKFCGNQPLEAG